MFICEKIWEAKHITNKDTKLEKLAITLRDRTLDWYMSLATNSLPWTTIMIGDIKKLLINEFQKPSSEDQYMNEMIEIRQKPREFVWDIDQRFKRLKGKLKYVMKYMQHRHMFCQLTITTLEISTATTKVSDAGRGSADSPATGRKSISEDRSNHRGDEGGS
jgi:hypothetical protein